jgi:hypothetical protein
MAAAEAARALSYNDPDAHLVNTDHSGPATVVNADGTATVAARTVGVQTKYRDGETQTDPFTPGYTVPEGVTPEVLAIAHLRVGGAPGESLPATAAEVALIQRIRDRRELEALLPPMTDEAGFHVRKKMMQDQELADWRFREAEMDDGNERKLEAIASALEERERRREFASEARVEAMRMQLEEEKDQAMLQIRHRRVKALRKLARDREIAQKKADAVAGTSVTAIVAGARTAEGAFTGTLESSAALAGTVSGGQTSRRKRGAVKRQGRDIVSDYADPSSTVYAPPRKAGGQPDRLGVATRFDVAQLTAVTGAQALNALESTLPAQALHVSVTRPTPSATHRGASAKATRQLDKDLERVHELLKTTTSDDRGPKAAALLGLTGAPVNVAASGGPVSAETIASLAKGALGRSKVDASKVPSWRKPKTLLARPATPRFEEEDETAAEAELEQAVLLIQRLLRGRAEQNSMCEGTDRRMALIAEIRRDLLRVSERRQVETEEAAVEAVRRMRRDLDAALDTLGGEAGAMTLDFLAKAQVRSEEQGRVKRVAERAREERRKREAEETGSRQAEEALRAKRDMVWRQLSRVHEAGAAMLVQDLMEQVVSSIAQDTSERQVLGAPPSAPESDAQAVADVVQASALAAEQMHGEAQAGMADATHEQAVTSAMEEAGLSPRP